LSRAKQLTVLEQIIVRKRAELVAQRATVDLQELERHTPPARRGFRKALEAGHPAIISEIKRASPSAGVIAENFDPAKIAAGYQEAGASALSVLTDKQFFQGSLQDLVRARVATRLPVLRKDFTLDRFHLLEASAEGADAVLLIVAALDDDELTALLRQARDLRLDALVEVHEEQELERAIAAGADLIGVNNRDLKTLEVSLDTSFRLAKKLPPGVLTVSESGIRTAEDIRRLMAAGYQAFLIGESLMRQPDPGAALAELVRGARGPLM
jgi:indole-3-glycerol phosphate synthase